MYFQTPEYIIMGWGVFLFVFNIVVINNLSGLSLSYAIEGYLWN